MYLNVKRGFFYNVMYHCPSKGRLLELKDTIGITPYHDYCLHCDSYRYAAEKVGLKYIYNFDGIDHAACSMLIYDPNVFDGRVIIDEDTLIMERKAADNEYFHRDFHSSMNMGLEYLGKKFGEAELVDFLRTYTRNVYKPIIAEISEKGLAAIETKILDTYVKEHATDAVKTCIDSNKLHVEIMYCPAVKHLKATGRVVSAWYPYSTSVVMEELAKAAAAAFSMESYDPETGAAVYTFEK